MQRNEKLLILIIPQYYFAVDNTYVTKKLGLLLFPFVHSDWLVSRTIEFNKTVQYCLSGPSDTATTNQCNPDTN